MKREQALARLGLADGVYKPIAIDKAYIKLPRNIGRVEQGQSVISDASEEASGQESRSSVHLADAPQELSLGPKEDDVWDSLYLDWVHMPDLRKKDMKRLSDRELYALRRERAIATRADEFQNAIECDYPRRTSFSWNDEMLFGDIKTLEYEAYKQASLRGDVFSPMVFTAELARARTQAILVDPSLIWIEGTRIKKGKEDNKGALKPKFDGAVLHALGYVSGLYGGCGIANAMRIVILRLGLGFDNDCKIMGQTYEEFELPIDLINCAVKDISLVQNYKGVPLDTTTYMTHIRSCCVAPLALRKAVFGEKSVLRDLYDGIDEFGAALDANAASEYSSPGTENMVRAIRDLEGDMRICASVTQKSYSPEAEARDCLMESPECMTRGMDTRSSADFLHEYEMYRKATETHQSVYNTWCYRESVGWFARLWDELPILGAGIIFSAFLLGFAWPVLARILFDMPLPADESLIDLRLASLSIPIGILAFLWDCYKWQIYLWYDARLENIRAPWRSLLDLREIWSFFLLLLSAVGIGFVISLFIGVFLNDTSLSLPRFGIIFSVVGLVALMIYGNAREASRRSHLFLRKPSSNEQAVRSAWETRIADHIMAKYPSLDVITNNRSIIRSERSFFRHLEIDILIPELGLAIEANGEHFHDHAAYNRDVKNNTIHTREMYKEWYLREKKGIDLLHVWDSESIDSIYHRIDSEIEARIS